LLTGKNPPDEIRVMAKFSESKTLNEKILSIKKIKRVKPEYNKNILIPCLNTSELLKEM
tara:strand:- start:139 stop:315 length:177 start_codon:yes stop_codon:yes gene_type:complete